MGAAEAGHAQPSTALAIYTQVYDRRRDEIRKQMSRELYERAKKKHEGRNLRAILVGQAGLEPATKRL